MTDKEGVASAIKEFILTEFLPGQDPDELSDSTDLIGSGIVDSLATLKLIVFVEERFRVTIAPHEAEVKSFGTIRDIAKLVTTKL